MRYVTRRVWIVIDTAENNRVLGTYTDEHKAKDRADMLNGLRRKK